jgi:enamine deaminase RidA (YjgF/YER057c/UK114 family)
MPTTVRRLNPAAIHTPPGYSHVVEVTGPARIVYFAGQVGLDRSGAIAGAPGDFEAQTAQAFENLKAALEAVGAGFEDLIKINNYMVDIARNLATFREVRNRYLPASAVPASTTIGISALAVPGLLFEIEAVAMLPA